MSNAKFRADIKRFMAKSNNGMSQYARKVILDLHSRIVNKTPVLSGSLRWNWQIGDGAINSLVEKNTDKLKKSVTNKAKSEVNSININGQIVYITNSVPYAYRIEYEGWSHTKAPAGMVRVTLAEVETVLKDAAFEVKDE